MIKSKADFKYYLEEDKKALDIKHHSLAFITNPYEIDFEIWRFQKALRTCEYFYNLNKAGVIWKIRKFFAARLFKSLSIKLGYTIPPNCFGPGLKIAHRGTIVVNGRARIGANCTINACVNIGAQAGFYDKVPIIGDNVYIAPGAKLYGDIQIANGCAIGANSVVNKSFLEPNSVIVGAPANVKGTVSRNLRDINR